MKTSRQRILDYILAHRAVTVADLARALRMTPANIRHHLGILHELGLVRPVGSRPTGGRGRPARLLGPSEQALGHHLDALAGALLDEFLAACPPEERPAAADSLAIRLANRLATRLAQADSSGRPATTIARNLSVRLYTAIRLLNHGSYQARWEAHSGAPRLILGHCPYSAIIAQHPELCQMDAALLNNMLSEPVEQIARLQPDQNGALFCMFRIGPLK